MNNLKVVALLTSALGVLGNFAAVANDTPTMEEINPLPLAQAEAGSIVGQCRAANRRLDIYSQRSVAPASRTLMTIDANGQLTLADGGTNGWVAVNAPTPGYVIARHLKLCTGTNPNPNPNPPANKCRVARTGLNIRPRAVAGAQPQVGYVPSGGTLYITGETTRDTAGRTWYKITQPNSGWISGGRDGASNLASCP